jgi:aspartyl protease family protein
VKALLAAAVLLAAGVAGAQTSVTLQGMLGAKALLIIDGSAPRSVAPGETYKGVKVLSTGGDQAVVEIAGRRETLRVGEAPASVGGSGPAPGRGSRIVMTATTGGHFLTPGSINGRPVQFLVDTGATSIAMGADDAERLGIDYRKGTMGRSATANGIVPMYQVRLDSVRIGDVEVHGVEATVLPMAMPQVLLGNSFLNRFDMKRENDQLVLERRY